MRISPWMAGGLALAWCVACEPEPYLVIEQMPDLLQAGEPAIVLVGTREDQDHTWNLMAQSSAPQVLSAEMKANACGEPYLRLEANGPGSAVVEIWDGEDVHERRVVVVDDRLQPALFRGEDPVDLDEPLVALVKQTLKFWVSATDGESVTALRDGFYAATLNGAVEVRNEKRVVLPSDAAENIDYNDDGTYDDEYEPEPTYDDQGRCTDSDRCRRVRPIDDLPPREAFWVTLEVKEAGTHTISLALPGGFGRREVTVIGVADSDIGGFDIWGSTEADKTEGDLLSVHARAHDGDGRRIFGLLEDVSWRLTGETRTVEGLTAFYRLGSIDDRRALVATFGEHQATLDVRATAIYPPEEHVDDDPYAARGGGGGGISIGCADSACSAVAGDAPPGAYALALGLVWLWSRPRRAGRERT